MKVWSTCMSSNYSHVASQTLLGDHEQRILRNRVEAFFLDLVVIYFIQSIRQQSQAHNHLLKQFHVEFPSD